MSHKIYNAQCFTEDELDIIRNITNEENLSLEVEHNNPNLNDSSVNILDFTQVQDLDITDDIEENISITTPKKHTEYLLEIDNLLDSKCESDSIIADYEKYCNEKQQNATKCKRLTDFIIDKQIVSNCESIGITNLYSWQEECLNYILKGKNIIVSSPPNTGKSLIIELSIVKRYFDNGGYAGCKKPVLMIFPNYSKLHKSLTRLKNILSNKNVLIKCIDDPSNIFFDKTIDIFLSLYDKANLFINKMNIHTNDRFFSTVVFSNIHLIGNSIHGTYLELALSKILLFKNKFEIQLIGSSSYKLCPALPNLLQANAYNNNPANVERSEYFYIGNDIYKYVSDKGLDKIDTVLNRHSLYNDITTLNKNKTFITFPIIASIIIDHFAKKDVNPKLSRGVLVYTKSKYLCDCLAQFLVQVNLVYKFNYVHSDQVNDLYKIAFDYNEQCSKSWLNNSIYVYHSDINLNLKKSILDAYRHGYINILITTNPLIQCSDLPISCVIIDGLNFRGYYIDKIGYDEMKNNCGNWPLTCGESFLIFPKLTAIKDLLNEDKCVTCKQLTSARLPRLFLECLFMKFDGSLISLTSIYQNTMNYHKKNCITSTLNHQTLEKLEAQSKQEIFDALSYLSSIKMIHLDPIKCYRITKIGNAVVETQLSPEDGDFIRNEISKTLSSLVLTSDIQPYYLLSPPLNMNLNWDKLVTLLKQLSRNELSILYNQFNIDINFAEHMSLKQKSGANVLIANRDIDKRYRKLYTSLINIALKNNGIKKVKKMLEMPYFELKQIEKQTSKYANIVILLCYHLEEFIMHKILLSFMLKMGSKSFIWNKLEAEFPLVTKAIKGNYETLASVQRSGIIRISKLLKKNTNIENPDERKQLASVFLEAVTKYKKNNTFDM